MCEEQRHPGMSRVGVESTPSALGRAGRPSCHSPLTHGAPAPPLGPAPARRDLGSSALCHIVGSTRLSRREAWQRDIATWASKKNASWEDYLEVSASKISFQRLTPLTELVGTVFRHCRRWPQPETWTFSFLLVQPRADGRPPGPPVRGCGLWGHLEEWKSQFIALIDEKWSFHSFVAMYFRISLHMAKLLQHNKEMCMENITWPLKKINVVYHFK